MTVPQETAPAGAGSDTASTRPSAADAGLSTDEEHACKLTELAGSPLPGLPPGFSGLLSGWRGKFRMCHPHCRICGTITGKPRCWDGLTMICVEPGPVGRY